MKLQISPFNNAIGFFTTRYYSRSDMGRKEPRREMEFAEVAPMIYLNATQ
jgi:hypothetical protein